MAVRFRAGVRVKLYPQEGIVLSDGSQGQTVVDPHLPALLPWLQTGLYNEEELALQVQSQQPTAATFLSLERLRRAGWLENVALTGPEPLQALWSSSAQRAAASTSLSLLVLEGVPAIGEWQSRLEGHPWLRPVERDGDLELVVCCDYRHPSLASYAARHQGPWLPLRLHGSEIWLGPLCGPHSNLGHLLEILRRNQTLGSWLSLREGSQALEDPAAWSFGSLALGLQWALFEAERCLVNPEFATRHLLVYQILEGRMTPHPVPTSEFPVIARDKPAPDCYRSLDWRTLWPQLQTILEERLGTALLLEEVEATRVALPLYYAHSLFPPQRQGLPTATLQQTQAGRSLRPGAAAFGALAETVERHSGLIRASDQRIRASLTELGAAALHPEECLLFSQAQSQRGEAFPTFDPNATLCWSPLRRWGTEQILYLPSALLYYADDGVEADPGVGFCAADSNGSCAGASLEEAIFHALLELVERDAVAIWWYNRLSRPHLDLQTLGPEVAAVAALFAAGGERVWALDLTHDLGIPVVAAISVRQSGPEEPAMGFGCHPNLAEATLSALQEAVQCSAIYERRSRRPGGEWTHHRLRSRDFPTGQSAQAAAWLEEHNTITDPYLLPQGQADPPALWPLSPTFAGDIQEIQSRLKSKGMEVLVLDQSRPEYPLRVAKVVVPGLRMFWRRLGPGRLYSVPVEMGWLERPRSEEELNPVSVFF